MESDEKRDETKIGCKHGESQFSCQTENPIPTRGNLFLPVRLLVWADGRGTVARADSAARAELQGAPKPKLLQLKNIQKYYFFESR
jgi:hypothetical protein